MTPDDKERLVLALKESGRTCMMCGDGANDVGALKQAQVEVVEQRRATVQGKLFGVLYGFSSTVTPMRYTW